MTNAVALGLIVAILAFLSANFALGWEAHIFLGRKFIDLLEWLAFWR